MTTVIAIRKPHDRHRHVRAGEMLMAVMPFTARNFARAILTPNPASPVRTTADGSTFKLLMTCHLTDDTDPDDGARGFRDRRCRYLRATEPMLSNRTSEQ